MFLSDKVDLPWLGLLRPRFCAGEPPEARIRETIDRVRIVTRGLRGEVTPPPRAFIPPEMKEKTE